MAKPALDLSTVKAHLRVEHDLDDPIIADYTAAAIDRTLAEVGLAGVLELPQVTETTLREFGLLYPAEAVAAVKKRNPAGAWETLATDQWTLSGNADTGHVITLAEAHLGGDDYRVEWTAGLSPLPAWFKVACLFLIGHYYENRSAVVIGTITSEVPMGFLHLCRPHKRWLFA
jgi:uncharacterized phiE125 gp8 family phage protein